MSAKRGKLVRASTDVSSKVVAGGLVGVAVVIAEGLLSGSLSWEGALAVALGALAAYLKGDSIAINPDRKKVLG